MAESASITNTQEIIEVKRQELPLSCPRGGEDAAGLHPRVYLPIEKYGEASCPYCGTHYRLVD